MNADESIRRAGLGDVKILFSWMTNIGIRLGHAVGRAFVLLTLFSAGAQADPIAVNIGVYDNVAFTQMGLAAVSDYLRENLPQTKVVEISTYGPYKRSKDDSGIRGELLRQMLEKIQPGDVITHLVVNAHASTREVNGEAYTSLRYLGPVYSRSSAPSADFMEIFAPLRGRLAPDATVVFNACSTLCGPQEDAARRAKMILDYLQVKDGSIYGGENHEMVMAGQMNKKYALLDKLPNGDFLRFAIPMSLLATAYGAMINISNGSSDIIHGLMQAGVNEPVYMAALATAYVGMRTIYPKIKDSLGKINRGRIFKFKSGELESVVSVRKLQELDRVYGVNQRNMFCRGLFE